MEEEKTNEMLEKEPLEIDSEKEKYVEKQKGIPQEPKNKAKKVNVGGILAGTFILIAVLMLLVVVFGNIKKKEKAEEKELDKTGFKSQVNFDHIAEKAAQQKEEIEQKFVQETKPKEEVQEQKSDDEILAKLDQNIAGNNKPVIQQNYNQNYSSSYKSDRPDTRNSRSTRKNVDGLNVPKNYVPQESSTNNTGSKSQSASQGRKTAEEAKAEYLASLNAQNQNAAQSANQNKMDFYNNQANNAGSGSYLPYNSIWDGTIISGALVTSIDTANPGVVIARVTENVYSSYDHSLLLIPEGSLLYATYNSSVSYGQKRIQVAWTLLIRPDGYRVQLGNMNGVDSQGKSGYKGFVNNHTWETAKALGLVACYSVIQTEVSLTIDSADNDYIENSLTDVYSEAAKIGNKVLDKALDIQPSILKQSGSEIKIITNTPLQLPPVEQFETTQRYIRTK